ncbi:hypothetical protein [Kitasatospora sp. NPDC050463]|uniref:hypothetical protein n=1 Tax=Kitasatospora sp. NPDC050463 TaxID=3155786 RepID=UPI0033CA84F9
MNEGTVEEQSGRAQPEGRMTEQDAERFRLLLARLGDSLTADRRAAAEAGSDV